MMRLILIAIVLIAYPEVQASDKWFCTDQSSEMSGDSVKVCGIGHGEIEEIARKDALSEAEREFNTICRMSSTCHGYPSSVIPGRITCEKSNSPETGYNDPFRWRCYRMLTFTIDRSKGHPDLY